MRLLMQNLPHQLMLLQASHGAHVSLNDDGVRCEVTNGVAITHHSILGNTHSVRRNTSSTCSSSANASLYPALGLMPSVHAQRKMALATVITLYFHF